MKNSIQQLQNILSNTTEINETQKTIRTFVDDEGNRFCTVFYNEDMLADYIEIYTDTDTETITGEDMQEVLNYILERQREL